MLGGTYYEWEGAVDLGFHVARLMDKDLLPQACRWGQLLIFMTEQSKASFSYEDLEL